MTRRRDSVKARRICFEAHRYTHPVTGRIMLDCHWGKHPINPAVDPWRADHIKRFANGGEDTAENLWPICLKCDVEEKAPMDNRSIAKGKRIRDKHYGITRPQGFRKPPEGYEYSWKARRVVKIGEDVE